MGFTTASIQVLVRDHGCRLADLPSAVYKSEGKKGDQICIYNLNARFNAPLPTSSYVAHEIACKSYRRKILGKCHQSRPLLRYCSAVRVGSGVLDIKH